MPRRLPSALPRLLRCRRRGLPSCELPYQNATARPQHPAYPPPKKRPQVNQTTAARRSSGSTTQTQELPLAARGSSPAPDRQRSGRPQKKREHGAKMPRNQINTELSSPLCRAVGQNPGAGSSVQLHGRANSSTYSSQLPSPCPSMSMPLYPAPTLALHPLFLG
jgi:hypothetical protein